MRSQSCLFQYARIQNFQESESVCKGMFLEGAVREIPGGADMLSFWNQMVVKVFASRKLMTPSGLVQLGDVVYAPGIQKALIANAFLKAVLLSGEVTFMAQVVVHEKKQGSIFEGSGVESLVVWRPDFQPVTFALRECRSIHVYLGGKF